MTIIAQNLEQICTQIPSSVRLIAVTKKVSLDKIKEAYQFGIRDFAENRLQEALDKQKALNHLTDICWHFIGHLQTNKAKKAIANFDWIHSVDSLILINQLNKLAQEAIATKIIDKLPKICLQVKILPDADKYGWEKDQLLTDLAKINELKCLEIRGLMSILPLGLSEKEILKAFIKVKELKEYINQQNYSNIHLKDLSMGMSSDYLSAIQAGATIIRLGTIIFGKRDLKTISN